MPPRSCLLITDQNRPKVSGLEWVKKLQAARLALPVILASGAMPTEQLDRHPWLRIEPGLLKPYTSMELLAAVQAVRCGTRGAREQIALLPI